jgi:hypothetical protein
VPDEEYKTMKFTGKLLDGDRVILPTIEGDFQETQGRAIQWWGRFTAPSNIALFPKKKYRLEIEDGRSCEIFVTQTRSTTPQQTVDFNATGPLQ